LLLSASDDGFVRVWDNRSASSCRTFEFKHPITSALFAIDELRFFVAGVDPVIHVYDMRFGRPVESLAGHADIITGMCLSSDGSYLLSNGMDNLLCAWDIRPFLSNNGQRLIRTFSGHSVITASLLY
jgi:Prp8 binding protein